MNCTLNVDQRRLTPGVFNLKQHLNAAETMVWKLTSRLTNNGECDLCDYDAFLKYKTYQQIGDSFIFIRGIK